MASISFRNVSKRFGDTVAVSNMTFDVDDNEFFCLFGPPLSGKSTILKMILGLETPDSGEILIGGKPVTSLSPAEHQVLRRKAGGGRWWVPSSPSSVKVALSSPLSKRQFSSGGSRK